VIVSGSERLPVAAAELRAILREPKRLVEVLPNVDAFTWLEDEESGAFTATLRPALALGEVPIRTVWRPTAAEGDGISYAVEGRTDEHWIGLEVSVTLATEDGGDATVAGWRVASRFTGTLRAVGQRVLEPIVAQQARAVLEAAARAVAANESRAVR
jgi:carbon monoxide dehydrogenase subunit G